MKLYKITLACIAILSITTQVSAKKFDNIVMAYCKQSIDPITKELAHKKEINAMSKNEMKKLLVYIDKKIEAINRCHTEEVANSKAKLTVGGIAALFTLYSGFILFSLDDCLFDQKIAYVLATSTTFCGSLIAGLSLELALFKKLDAGLSLSEIKSLIELKRYLKKTLNNANSK